MQKNTSVDNNFVLFLFNDYHTDYELIRTQCYAKVFFESRKFINTHALLFNFTDNPVEDREDMTYLRLSPKLKRKPLITPLAMIFAHVLWIKNNRPSLVVISGAPAKQDFRFLYRLMLPKQKFAVIMATTSVAKSRLLRSHMNLALKFNLLFFSNLIVGNYWRHDLLRLPGKKIRHAVLGFHDYGFTPKDFTTLKLVYLGVLTGRGVEDTIEGLAIFVKRNPDIEISYDIFGKAKEGEIQVLNDLAVQHNLQSLVRFHGFLSQEDGAKVVQSCNIGVAYTKVTSYFGARSTKTLEYLIAGLPVIATPTRFKRDYINESNGIIHEDNPEAFARALEIVCERRFEYKPEEIRKNHLQYTLEGSIENDWVPLFKSLMAE